VTPAEYAADVLRKYRDDVRGVPAEPVLLGQLIAAAVRAAVDEERRACEQIVYDITREDVEQKMRAAFRKRKEAKADE
jgi:hypothetical protein